MSNIYLYTLHIRCKYMYIYTWVLLLHDFFNLAEGQNELLMCHLQLSVRTLAWKIYKFKCNWDIRPWGNKQFFVGNWQWNGGSRWNQTWEYRVWGAHLKMMSRYAHVFFHIWTWNEVIMLAWGILYEVSCIVHQGHLRSSRFRWLETRVYLRRVYTWKVLLRPLFIRCFALALLRVLQTIA